MAQRLGVFLAVMAMLLAAAGDEPAAAQPAAGPRLTEVRVLIVTEFGGLNPAIRLNPSRLTGSCFTGSLANPGRSDAWRCSSGNAILDPCFQSGFDPPSVVCVRTPWDSNGIEIALDEPLRFPSDPPAMLDSQPWAIELAGGVRCTVASTGAGASLAGMRVNYSCDNGNALVGKVYGEDGVWWIFMRRQGTWELVLTPVAVAWY